MTSPSSPSSSSPSAAPPASHDHLSRPTPRHTPHPPQRAARSRLRARALTAPLAALGVAVASLALPSSAAPAVAAPLTQQLISHQSGRCLDVAGNSNTNGALMDIWDCNNQSNQGFNFTSAGQIQAFGGTKCLDVTKSGTAPGTTVGIWDCNGQPNQQFTWGANNTIVAKQSGLCLDVDNASKTPSVNTANGRGVILWTCSSQLNEQWSNGGGPEGTTMVVDAATTTHAIDRVGNNFLYGLSDASTPPASIVAPLQPSYFRQPPPGAQHRPNGVPEPVGDPLKVYSTVQSVNAGMIMDMADSFDGFPYDWTSWDDWNRRVDTMIANLKAHPEVTSVKSWEPWNEPDWTWPASAGPFNDGWARTVKRIKASDSTTPILGPSPSLFNIDYMRSFLSAAKASGTLPDITCWHELSGWQHVTADVAAYRNLEKELGISPRPISIDEYATPDEIDVASSTNHYIAQFERTGVRDAERAFWFEPGTLNGLLHNGQPTASYWMYKWYADQSGTLVKVTPTTYQDGVASYDASAKKVSVVFAGQAGNNAIKVTGISGLGSSVKATLTYVPGSGRTTNNTGPTTVSTATYPVSGGAVTVPVSNQDAFGAYNLVLSAN